MTARTVVMQAEGFPDPDPPWLPVGLVAWPGEPARSTVVIKATFAHGSDGELVLSARQEALSAGVASEVAGAVEGELAAPDDFVPRKAAVDVLVTGSAFAPGAVTSIEAAIRIGGWVRRFTARAGAPATRIPLSAAYLGGERVGPAAAPARPRGPLGDDFDFAVFNAAPAARRLAAITGDETIILEHLVAGSPRAELRLPGLVPVVAVGAGDARRLVEVRCDTIWIDTARNVLTLTFRGELPTAALNGTSALAVSVERAGAERDDEDRLAAFQRGAFGLTVGPDDPREEAPADDDERAAVTRARYATWSSDAPAPRMPLPEYARLAAVLAERPEDRASTLADAGLDEDRFLVEERAWLERIARRAGDGDATLAADFAHALAAAQEAAAIPRELDLGAYADLSVGLDRAADPAALLREAGLSIPQWIRVDSRWTDAAAADPVTAAAVEGALASARERIPETPDDAPAGEDP